MWKEGPESDQPHQATMTDVAFRIECTNLPVDHAHPLAAEVIRLLPWLEDCRGAGVHPIHVAGSQNGWERPMGDSELLVLSKRTRLRIRIESARADELMQQLTGANLSIAGHPLHVLSGEARPLKPAATLFSRQVVFNCSNSSELDQSVESEPEFIDRVIEHCRTQNFEPTKILCGKLQLITTDTHTLVTRSVLLADVPDRNSLPLQDHGIGDGRLFGCGLLVPHKDTGAVYSNSTD